MNRDQKSKVQRVGNYFVKIKQGVRGQHTNVVPESKLYKRRVQPNLFAALWTRLKSKLGI